MKYFAAGITFLQNCGFTLAACNKNIKQKIMSFTAKNDGPEIQLPDEDVYPSRLVWIIDLGTHTHPSWGTTHRCLWGFEIFGTEKEDGTPFIMTRFLPLKLTAKSDMGKILKKWKKIVVARGEEFDFSEILGEPAMIDCVMDEDDEKMVIESITSPKNTKVPKATEPLVLLSLDENFDEDVFAELPEWIQDIILESEEAEELGIEAPKKGKGKKKSLPGKAKSKKARDEEEEEEEEEDDRKSKKSKRKVKDEEEEEEEEEDTPPRKNKKKVVDEEEEEEEDEKPKRSKRRKEEDEEEEEEEEEEDERPAKKKLPKKTGRKR